VCPTELSDLVFSLECLVSNGRRALLAGIRLGGSAIMGVKLGVHASHRYSCNVQGAGYADMEGK